jgi:hypothetical protein
LRNAKSSVAAKIGMLYERERKSLQWRSADSRSLHKSTEIYGVKDRDAHYANIFADPARSRSKLALSEHVDSAV